MKYFTLLFIYGKRQLKGGFLIALLIMPLLVLGVKYFVPEQSTALRVGFISEDKLISKELSEHKGYVTFVQENSEEALITRVKNRTYECGYIIPENMDFANLKNTIIRGENPSSVLSEVIDEIVFSKLIKVYGYQVAVEFANENNINIDNLSLESKYNEYVNSDAVFSLDFEMVKNTLVHTSKPTKSNIAVGLMWVYIMLGGLLGCLNWYNDEKRGIYIWGMGNVISATFLMCLFGLISVFLGGNTNIIREMALMSIYFVAVCGYCCLVKVIFNNSTALCGGLPVIVVACLCFCPVVFNVGSFFPALECVGKIFPPYYCMDYVNGGSINGLVVFGGVCWGLYWVLERVKG